MHGLAKGNHVIVRPDSEIAADVNMSLHRVVELLEQRREHGAPLDVDHLVESFRARMGAVREAEADALANLMQQMGLRK